MEILTQPPRAEVQANEERQGNLLQEYEQRFQKLSEDQKLSRLCSEAGLRLVELDNSSMLFRHQEGKKINPYAENTRCFEIKKELVSKGGSKAMYDLVPSRTYKFAITTEDTVLKFKFNLCFKIKPYHGLEL